MKTSEVRAKISIVGFKFLESSIAVDALLTFPDNIKSPFSVNIPLSDKTKHLKSYKEIIETQILEYLNNERA